MSELLKRKYVDIAFKVGVVLKILNSIVEIVGSFLILIVTQAEVVHLVGLLTQEELSEDPKDFLANYLVKSAEHFSISAQTFASLYLLSHGIIKFFLMIGLLKKKLWVYPVTLIFFFFFIIYQFYRYTITYSPILIFLSVFDFIVMWLVWREYRYLKS